MSYRTNRADAELTARMAKLGLLWGVGFLVLSLFLVSGCAQKEKAVELYVDAVMLRELGENKMAVEKLDRAIKADKNLLLAYSLRGEIYHDLKEYDESAADYEKALDVNPWSFEDRFNLGRVYWDKKEFSKAALAYVGACQVEPKELKAHINAAKSFYRIKQYKEALSYGQRAEQIDPGDVEVQKLLGDIYDSQEDYGRAIAAYQRALETESDNPEIMSSLAVVYLRTGKYEPAKELLKTVTGLEPANNNAYQYLGYCYLQLEDVDKSIESYQWAIEINDRDWQALRGLGVAYMLKALNTGDELLKAEAVRKWRLSLDVNPRQDRRDKLVTLIRRYSR